MERKVNREVIKYSDAILPAKYYYYVHIRSLNKNASEFMNFFKKYSHILFEKVMRVSSSTGPFPKGLLQLELDSAKYR